MSEPDLLSEELMLGSFFKEFADRGHWFNARHTKCALCGVPTIDLFEDGWYGESRGCPNASQQEATRAKLGTSTQEALMPRKETSAEISSKARHLWRHDPLSDLALDDIIQGVRDAIANGTQEDAREAIRGALRDYVTDVQSVAASAVSQDETAQPRGGRPTAPQEETPPDSEGEQSEQQQEN